MYIGRITAKLVNRCFSIWGVLSEGEHAEHPRTVELGGVLKELMGFIFNKLKDSDCHKNWSRLVNYFTLMMDIAKGGKYQTIHILENFDFVVDICDVMLG